MSQIVWSKNKKSINEEFVISSNRIIIPEAKIKIGYCLTHDCDDSASQLCQKFGRKNCRALRIKGDHALNVMRFSKENKHYHGKHKYFYCIMEPQTGESKSCWESDSGNFFPPNLAYCKAFKEQCERGIKLEIFDEDILSKIKAGEKPWWTNPFDNPGAVYNVCRQYNEVENRGSYKLNVQMPECSKFYEKKCKTDNLLACRVKSKKGGENCITLQCKSKAWVFVNWRTITLPSCDQLKKKDCTKFYFVKDREKFNRLNCKQAIKEDPKFVVKTYHCEGKKPALDKSNKEWPNLNPYKHTIEKHNTVPDVNNSHQ